MSIGAPGGTPLAGLVQNRPGVVASPGRTCVLSAASPATQRVFSIWPGARHAGVGTDRSTLV